jgi:large subunit ribosomal protein L29
MNNSAKELREMTSEQLSHELIETRKELLDRAVRASASQDDTGPSKSFLRRRVARIKTLLRERELKTSQA